MSFLEELKRRNVYRVAIAYALVAWMLVNVTSVFVPALNLPAWTVSLVALLVIVGFPVALGFAWVYELTPEGLKRSADIRVEHSVKHVTARKLNNFIFGALVVALVLLALDDYVMHGRTVLATSAAASTARIDSTNGPVSPERAVTTPSPTIITRFDYVVPEEINLGAPARAMLSIAQSGELFAFSGANGIYVRRLGEVTTKTIVTQKGYLFGDVAVSPDGREIAYLHGSPYQLMKVAIEGGTPIPLADVPYAGSFGITWERDGTLFYGMPDGVWRLSHSGGGPERVIKTEWPELAYAPHLLPGGESLLFTLSKTDGANRWNEADIVIQSLLTSERRVLRSGGFDARYLPTGQITYVNQDVVYASNFDVKTLKLEEERVPLVSGVQTAFGAALYSIANNGTLIFVPKGAFPPPPQKTLVWVDRAGNATPLRLQPNDYTMARISPDGTKIALVIGAGLAFDNDPSANIYIFDLQSGNLSQLTFGPSYSDAPVWSHDSSRIYYRSAAVGPEVAVYTLPVDGGTPQLVSSSNGASVIPKPWSISPDGRTLLVAGRPSSGSDLWTLEIGQSGKVMPLFDSGAEPSLSPNGEWLLSTSDGQVDIRPYPDVKNQRRRVGPGINPVFSSNGSELFAFDDEGLSAASVRYSPFSVGNFQRLFGGKYWYGVSGPGRTWDVDPKKDRFLMITLPQAEVGANAGHQARISVVLNWFDELRQRMAKH